MKVELSEQMLDLQQSIRNKGKQWCELMKAYYGDIHPKYGGVLVNLKELPDGTVFHVANGNWDGCIRDGRDGEGGDKNIKYVDVLGGTYSSIKITDAYNALYLDSVVYTNTRFKGGDKIEKREAKEVYKETGEKGVREAAGRTDGAGRTAGTAGETVSTADISVGRDEEGERVGGEFSDELLQYYMSNVVYSAESQEE